MVMLSKFRHFRLRDESGQQYRLGDLAVALLESDYPAVTRLLYKNCEREQMMLPWDAVKSIDWRYSQIEVRNFGDAEPVTPESVGKEVLLRRDVVDALVLDLHNRRATRANDLWLEEENGQLLLKAADTTSWAVLRRLSRGLFGSRPSRAPYDWKYIEFLRGDPRAVRNGAGYHMRIKRLPPGEIAGLSSSLPYLHAAELLTLLPDPVAADTLEAMAPERQLQVFGELEVTFDQSIREARLKLRESLKQTDFTHFIYVVESAASRALRGTTSLQHLIMAEDEQPLQEILNLYVTTLDPLEPADAGAYRVLNSHLAALPVVGREKRLLGILTVDAAVMQVAPESWSVQAPKIFS